jgi:hypothetical protein
VRGLHVAKVNRTAKPPNSNQESKRPVRTIESLSIPGYRAI